MKIYFINKKILFIQQIAKIFLSESYYIYIKISIYFFSNFILKRYFS